jgi:hypothetical protein
MQYFEPINMKTIPTKRMLSLKDMKYTKKDGKLDGECTYTYRRNLWKHTKRYVDVCEIYDNGKLIFIRKSYYNRKTDKKRVVEYIIKNDIKQKINTYYKKSIHIPPFHL